MSNKLKLSSELPDHLKPIKITALGEKTLYVYGSEEQCDNAIDALEIRPSTAEVIQIQDEWRGLLFY